MVIPRMLGLVNPLARELREMGGPSRAVFKERHPQAKLILYYKDSLSNDHRALSCVDALTKAGRR
jgi:hypothetical protein